MKRRTPARREIDGRYNLLLVLGEPMKRLITTIAVLLAAVGAMAFAAAGCGGSHEDKTASNGNANAVDRAFASEMTVHHQGALDMAQMAGSRAEHGEIRALATSIISSQTGEISQLRAVSEDIGARAGEHGGGHDTATPGAGGEGANLSTLGLSAEQAGMHHDASMLSTAKPFDRAFVDMMVPHHQGALRMARVELARGKNAKLRSLAQAIIAAQSREIVQMNAWRRGWYGAASRAGGIPA